MSLTREEIININCDVVKTKYYNANKVGAHLEMVADAYEALLKENEELKNGGAVKGEIGDALLTAQKTAAQLLNETRQEAEKLLAEAKAQKEASDKLMAAAKAESDQMLVVAKAEANRITNEAESSRALAAAALSENQLAAIDKLNAQLDELNVSHATQVYRLKQALMKMASDI